MTLHYHVSHFTLISTIHRCNWTLTKSCEVLSKSVRFLPWSHSHTSSFMVWYNLSSLKTQVRPPPSPHIAPPIPMDPRVMHQTDVNTPDGISQQHVTSSRSVTKHQFVHSFSVCEPLLPQIQGHFVEKTMQAVNMTSSAGMGLSTDINIESLLDAPLTRLGLRRRDLVCFNWYCWFELTMV